MLSAKAGPKVITYLYHHPPLMEINHRVYVLRFSWRNGGLRHAGPVNIYLKTGGEGVEEKEWEDGEFRDSSSC